MNQASEFPLYKAIDAYIEEQMRRLSIPGASLAIVEGDRIVHLRGFGAARPGGETPTPETPFFIGSLTKSVTALAVMQLVEAGKVALDAPVQRYLPWFRVADAAESAQITVRHLLNHTSGLPMTVGLADLGDLDPSPEATERQVRSLASLKLDRPVGSKFDYCNTNYNILGLIIEAASGMSYGDYVRQRIFDPLEMQHSYTDKAAAQQDGLAMGHRYWFGVPVPVPDLSIPAGSLPSGQLISSAEDMAHYLIAHLNGGRYCEVQILSPAGIAELTRGAAEINEMGASLGNYGMGWISQEIGEAKIAWHSGIVPDFGAIMALAPEQKKGFVLLFNANHAMMKLTFDELGLNVAQLLVGAVPPGQTFGWVPWAMRLMLLVPALQIAGVVATLRRRKADPAPRPADARLPGRRLLLPLLTNLLPALALLPMLGRMRGFVKLFMPDFAWLAWISGGFALAWSMLQALLARSASKGNRA